MGKNLEELETRTDIEAAENKKEESKVIMPRSGEQGVRADAEDRRGEWLPENIVYGTDPTTQNWG